VLADIRILGRGILSATAGRHLDDLVPAELAELYRQQLQPAKPVIDAAGRAWVSATTPRKQKANPAARLVRIMLESGSIAGTVKLGTDGGGGVGVSPDGSRAPRTHLAGNHEEQAPC